MTTRQQRHREHIFQLCVGSVLTVAGVAAVFIGLYMPPVGEIHPSVITVFGMSLAFVGGIIGIDYHYKAVTDKINIRLARPREGEAPEEDEETGN